MQPVGQPRGFWRSVQHAVGARDRLRRIFPKPKRYLPGCYISEKIAPGKHEGWKPRRSLHRLLLGRIALWGSACLPWLVTRIIALGLLGRDGSARPCNHGSSEPSRHGGQFILYPPPPRVKVTTPHPEVHGDLAHYPPSAPSSCWVRYKEGHALDLIIVDVAQDLKLLGFDVMFFHQGEGVVLAVLPRVIAEGEGHHGIAYARRQTFVHRCDAPSSGTSHIRCPLSLQGKPAFRQTPPIHGYQIVQNRCHDDPLYPKVAKVVSQLAPRA